MPSKLLKVWDVTRTKKCFIIIEMTNPLVLEHAIQKGNFTKLIKKLLIYSMLLMTY